MNSEINHSISIRKLTENDSEILYNLIDNSRLELANLVWAKTATHDSTIEFIKNKNNSSDKVHGVFHEDNLVGVLELRTKDRMLELGYWIGSQYRGLGLMKIAVKMLVDKKVANHKIVAHIRQTNKASHHILQYAGLEYDHTEIWENEPWLHLKRNKQ